MKTTHRSKEASMKHKLMVLFTTLILFSFVIAPVGRVQAQDTIPGCPPYQPSLLQEEEFLASLSLECIRAYKETARQANPPKAEITANAEAKAVGDPDKFGYTYEVVASNWIAATTNTGLAGNDAFTGPINIGFSFPFYGTNQTQLYLNTNGLITFGTGSRKWGGSSIPNDLNPNNLI